MFEEPTVKQRLIANGLQVIVGNVTLFFFFCCILMFCKYYLYVW